MNSFPSYQVNARFTCERRFREEDASVVAADEDASASYAAGTYALAGRLTAGADASVRAAVGLATRMSPALFA